LQASSRRKGLFYIYKTYTLYIRRQDLVEFRWIEWNVQHIAQHGVEPEEAEEVVLTGVTMKGRENALIATGPTSEGRFLFVVYKKDGNQVFVITARNMTEKEKRSWRKRYGKKKRRP